MPGGAFATPKPASSDKLPQKRPHLLITPLSLNLGRWGDVCIFIETTLSKSSHLFLKMSLGRKTSSTAEPVVPWKPLLGGGGRLG